ncbi:hypothetical protein M0811_09789 [Anaeramoeba ignava]|uniref:BTB domain-containing protein n=1 Tax=Anaeramoeba ignava TaxID=1746090 RepID=A0A9Q0LG92_ANAIG|nr:hypothetical protein M0811_09789 [Anaeramoeba ignava]
MNKFPETNFEDIYDRKYLFSNTKWVEIIPKNQEKESLPSQRTETILYDHKLWIFGGGKTRTNVFDHFYTFDLRTHITTKIEPKPGFQYPEARWGHKKCVSNDRMYVFGGHGKNSYLNDLWEYNFEANEWKQIKGNGDIPPNRSDHTIVSYKNKEGKTTFFVYGGWDGDNNTFHKGGFYTFDPETKVWSKFYPSGYNSDSSPVSLHTCCVYGDSLYFYSGRSGGSRDLKKTFVYSIPENTWKKFEIYSWSENDTLYKNDPIYTELKQKKEHDLRIKLKEISHDNFSMYPNSSSSSSSESEFQFRPYSRKMRTNKKGLKPFRPSSRTVSTAVLFDNKMFVFGNFSEDDRNLYYLDLETHCWFQAQINQTHKELPNGRFGHDMIIYDNKIIVCFGIGSNFSGPFNSIYQIELEYPLVLDLKFFFYQFRNDIFDIQFNTWDNKTIRANKAFLSIRCKDVSLEQISSVFSSFSYKDVDDVLHYIYTGRYRQTRESKDEILKMAINLKLNHLENLCRCSSPIGINENRILQDMDQLYYTREKSFDFILDIDGKEILLHKFVLAARSELFRGMFLSVEDNSNRVQDYSGKSYESICALVEFLYRDEFTVNEKICFDLLGISEFFLLKGTKIEEICSRFIIFNNLITIENVLEIDEKARIYFLERLRNHTKKFILTNFEELKEQNPKIRKEHFL